MGFLNDLFESKLSELSEEQRKVAFVMISIVGVIFFFILVLFIGLLFRLL